MANCSTKNQIELILKLNNVYDDYDILEEVLGSGLNGKI